MKNRIIYIIFGVSGSGKTTIGKVLAKNFNIPFYDADDFHPEANLIKMSAGIPLDDDDRTPWLQELSILIKDAHTKNGAVVACSALKKKYRKTLQSIDSKYIRWIFLEGSFDLIADRIARREHHFFKKEMLLSQFETLERPKNGIIVAIDKSSTEIINEITSMLNSKKSQLGVIGLGVMGKSLAKNFLSKGYSLSVYNRQLIDVEEDIAKNFVAKQPYKEVKGFDDLYSFVKSLEQPRTIMLMVNAGKPVDIVIDSLLPLLAKGDCIIDGGNSHYKLTLERCKRLDAKGIHFLGTGISGGEEGALKGPSIMPGGSKNAYDRSGKFLETIAARDTQNNPCCTYIGPDGSGHYIKMVHNGIEYGEMQLLAETYHLLRFYGKKTPDQIAAIFDIWRNNGLQSYLLEITIAILRKKEGGDFLIDKILDQASQKGTGGWSTNAALDIGMPLSTIAESVMARNISSMKSQRVTASETYQLETSNIAIDDVFIKKLEKAFQTASIINHHMGFELIKEASKTYKWNLNLSEIARIWTNGCIIRSSLMEQIAELFLDHNHSSLLLFPEIVTPVRLNIGFLSEIVSIGLKSGYSLAVFSAAANYFLAYTSAQSSANMIQAQRDYFGAHTYQRIDQPMHKYFHTNWKN